MDIETLVLTVLQYGLLYVAALCFKRVINRRKSCIKADFSTGFCTHTDEKCLSEYAGEYAT